MPAFDIDYYHLPALPSWNQTNFPYLRIHQSVGKRKSLRRVIEILTVLSGSIVRPLLCNFVREGPPALRLAPAADSAKPSSESSSSASESESESSSSATSSSLSWPSKALSLSSLSTSTPYWDWDAFWSRRLRGRTSNARRVAQGLQRLGPTFVKFGQALATRPDLLNVPLADELVHLQDNMAPFDNGAARRIIRRDLAAMTRDKTKRYGGAVWDDSTLDAFMDSLSAKPVAASIAQVYSATLPGYGKVAVKVQRPKIRRKVERDATLFHSVATWIEARTWPAGTPLSGEPLVGNMQIVRAVDEFTARVFEEMDFESEANNIRTFGRLYSHRWGLSETVRVVVPELIPELSGRRILVMEWIEGRKLTDVCDDCDDREEAVAESLALVKKAIECGISQLIDTGILHADPHTGNLLKVRTREGTTELGYLDFGLISDVPQAMRDGIVCAVVQLVFARNVEAVADLCAAMELLPEEKMADPVERKKLVDALKGAFDDLLLWPKDARGRSTAVPKVRFENLISSLSGLVGQFEFTVPPYFLNNARALATLEGIALKLDPDFNILRVVYPYSINRLMRNPSVSRLAEETFLDICRSPETKLFDLDRTAMLLNDWALLTGYRRRKIVWDLATSEGGRRVSRRIIREWYLKRYRRMRTRALLVRKWCRRRLARLRRRGDPPLVRA